MPKKVEEKSAKGVRDLVAPGFYAVGGVSGLHLHVQTAAARSWVLRIKIGTKRRDMGLGGFPDVGLAQARERAREARDLVRQGIDPVQRAQEARSALRMAQAKAITFAAAAQQYITAHAAGWKSAKHAAQWGTTLETYAYPVMGDLHVQHVELAHVLKVLEPIWRSKTETASRLRGRIELVLDWATVRGYRAGLNPARWRGHLDKLLPKPSKVSKVEHHDALPVDEVAAFMVKLRAVGGMGARALEFAILTAARSGEVRGARWDEIDLAAGVWTVPAARMKAGKEHRVPLSQTAIDLLRALPQMADSAAVFPAPRGGVLSDMTLSAVMRRMKVDAVPHGFRSTFRDWSAERTNYPRDVAEMALAHTIDSKVEAAYRRGDLFEKRRRMMDDWAAFLSKVEQPGTVIPINRQAA